MQFFTTQKDTEMETKSQNSTSIRIPQELRELIKKMAEEQSRSFSNMVIMLLNQAVKK